MMDPSFGDDLLMIRILGKKKKKKKKNNGDGKKKKKKKDKKGQKSKKNKKGKNKRDKKSDSGSKGGKKQGKKKGKKKRKNKGKKKSQRPAEGSIPGFHLPYRLYQPTNTFRMPHGAGDLGELSGIAYDSDNDFIIMIEDTYGFLYAYDERSMEIVFEERFAKDGDYEDVAITPDGIVWVSRSDGVIFRIDGYPQGIKKVEKIETHLTKADNVEGLTWDHVLHKLLVACKAQTLDESEKRVYSFDIETRTLSEDPIFTVALADIERVLGEKIKKFNPSAIALHPDTNDIYMCATSGQLLVVISHANFQVLSAHHLPRDPFLQPEGLDFDPKTDAMYISNEGRGKEGYAGVGTVLKFKFQAQADIHWL